MALPTLPGADPFPSELEARLRDAAAQRGDLDHGGARRFVNRLALETSPYLRQHDGNPVNWYPWGDEAFAEARRLHRPVFLSIGYSTCHWCHVMAKESFADSTIAALLNARYVSVKVDREERPDLDAKYLRAAQALGGGGGWPLSVWLTEDREPFFAGTYFPPYAGVRGVEAGLFEYLMKLVAIYQEEPSRVREVSRIVGDALRTGAGVARVRTPGQAVVPVEREGLARIAAAVAACESAFDERHGGLRAAQKFPSHVPVRLLLRYHQRTGDERALRMAVRTLEAMCAGGIYDQVAGGFHRYATDPAWRVPHFEKMLYDNALLVVAYAEAWQLTHQARFARVVRETCDALLGTFAGPAGGFFSATDADSEGEEGKYFVWTEAEIRSVLGADPETEAFLRYFGVSGEAELDLGHVLHEEQADEQVRQGFAEARARLCQARLRRLAPHRDEKMLSAWNGLAISALAVAGRVLGEARYVEAAARAADFVLRELRDPEHGGLARTHCEGKRSGPGFLADHALVVAGLLDLFESTSEPCWFDAACSLADDTERIFADPDGGWFDTGPHHERLFAREKSTYDGAEPAGSSVALMNAARLAAFTDDERWREVTRRALSGYWPLLGEQPLAMAEALLAVDFCAGPAAEIVLATAVRDPAGSEALSRVLRETFCPQRVLVVCDPESAAWSTLRKRIPFLRDKTARDGHATGYVCSQGSCQLPTSSTADFARQIRESTLAGRNPRGA
jgi:uncharacterized protein